MENTHTDHASLAPELLKSESLPRILGFNWGKALLKTQEVVHGQGGLFHIVVTWKVGTHLEPSPISRWLENPPPVQRGDKTLRRASDVCSGCLEFK